MTGNDTQQRLAAFIGRETEYWDFWGTIRIIKSGSILWETSRGYACAEFGVKNRISSLGGEGFQVHPSASIPVYL